jgi:hypothetical protein
MCINNHYYMTTNKIKSHASILIKYAPFYDKRHHQHIHSSQKSLSFQLLANLAIYSKLGGA